MASKWLKVPVLLDVDEMESLLQELGEGSFYITSGVVEEGVLPHDRFIAIYRDYLVSLKTRSAMDLFRIPFSSVWSSSPHALYSQEVEGGRHLLRVRAPVIQLRPHGVHYSPVDGRIRSMTPGVSWGIEFSYPTLVQNPKSGAIEKVSEGGVNTAPFTRMRRWMRRHTLPVPFLVNGEKMTVPIRLGKGCFSWINRHPELGELEVVC